LLPVILPGQFRGALDGLGRTKHGKTVMGRLFVRVSFNGAR